MEKSCFCKSTVDNIYSAFYVTFLVCIFNTEDEISAGFTTLGGVLAGKRSFTATSGPGNMLMQESMCMAEMMRLPAVFIIQQRGGPSTATVIYSQQEVTMTTHGGNGEGFRFVYSTCSHQELFDYGVKAFQTAWKYRFPTFILGDGYQAKMREPVTLYDPELRGLHPVEQEVFMGKEGLPGVDRPPVHLRNTYNTEDELRAVVEDLNCAYQAAAPLVCEYQTYDTDDCEVLILAHGVVTRAAQAAVSQLRAKGIKAGHFRPVTLRPFAGDALRPIADRAKVILVAESSLGQLEALAAKAIYGCSTPMEHFFKPGEGITDLELVEKVQSLLY